MNNNFYNKEELQKIGFAKVGDNVFVSRNACFYGESLISIGSNVRIDDFCVLSGKITIGNNVHISSSSLFFGGNNTGIIIGNYCNVSSRCGIYAISDNFSEASFVGPMADTDGRIIIDNNVILKDYAAIGTGSTVLPGTYFEEGAVLGAMSLAKDLRLESWSIYCGVPCHKLKNRKKTI